MKEKQDKKGLLSLWLTFKNKGVILASFSNLIIIFKQFHCENITKYGLEFPAFECAQRSISIPNISLSPCPCVTTPHDVLRHWLLVKQVASMGQNCPIFLSCKCTIPLATSWLYQEYTEWMYLTGHKQKEGAVLVQLSFHLNTFLR